MKYEITNQELETIIIVIADLVTKTLTVGQVYQIVWKLVELVQLTKTLELENWSSKTEIDINVLQSSMNLIADGTPKTLSVWVVYQAINILQNLKQIEEEKVEETPARRTRISKNKNQ